MIKCLTVSKSCFRNWRPRHAMGSCNHTSIKEAPSGLNQCIQLAKAIPHCFTYIANACLLQLSIYVATMIYCIGTLPLFASSSISNLGMYGITEFTAIINPPQSAILAVGRAQLRPTISGDGGLVGVSRTILVTLSCDARVIDYELACGWLETFRKIMESPAANLL